MCLPPPPPPSLSCLHVCLVLHPNPRGERRRNFQGEIKYHSGSVRCVPGSSLILFRAHVSEDPMAEGVKEQVWSVI